MGTTAEQCAERVYRGAWSERGQCKRKAGKGAAYCKQHAANHAEGDTIAVWYSVGTSTYSVSIKPVDVLEIHNAYLIIKNGQSSERVAVHGKYDTYVPTREEAIERYRSRAQALRNQAAELDAKIDAWIKST